MAEVRPWLLAGVAVTAIALLAFGLWIYRPGGQPILVDYYRVVDEDSLIVGIMEGSSGEARVTEVRETSDSVTIIVRHFREIFGATGGTASPVELAVELQEPLADRAVFDPHHSVPPDD